MEYITVYETFKTSEAHILSNIFQNNGIRFRLLDERTNDIVPIGMRLQVIKEDKDQALILIRENGFLGERLAKTNETPTGKFWIYLFVALLIVIIVGALISLLLDN